MGLGQLYAGYAFETFEGSVPGGWLVESAAGYGAGTKGGLVGTYMGLLGSYTGTNGGVAPPDATGGADVDFGIAPTFGQLGKCQKLCCARYVLTW